MYLNNIFVTLLTQKMTNILFSVFLSFFYSIVYKLAGPMISAQDIKFDQSQLLSFAVCFILSSAVNFFIFSVIPKLHLCTGNGRVAQYQNRGLDKVGNRRLFLFVWAFIFVSWIPAYLILYPGVLAYYMI